ncbi:hypothetical protein MVI01_01130 [Myxococcus virescens]|uniref:Transposase n=1 Tax=Myxococcus virescens TaxID=83456 RepID=A0A511H682_9BACT|nr:hypothetical protein MVI01_01130 [Myxococcus virescens]SDE29451.1 transposase [Myxococcus virescens]
MLGGIEPTNNFGEQCIRHAVMYRKTSFGTQGPEGSCFVERIFTAVTTLKLQERGVLDFLTDTLRTHRRSLPPPRCFPLRRPLSLRTQHESVNGYDWFIAFKGVGMDASRR